MNKRNIGSLTAIVVFCLVAGFLLAGCSTSGNKKVPPVSVGEIVQMSKSGMSPEDIMAKIRESGTVYRLKASELVDLKKQGVSDEVIDYMQKTYIRAVQHDQRLQDESYWTRQNDGYWYGGMWSDWPYDPFWYGSEESGEHGEGHHHDRR